jgi:hypothetical protein
MAVLGCILLILAGLIHSWWGAQAKADLDQKAAGFFFWGLKPLYITILLLAFGEGLIWYGANLGLALAAIFIYFFILPVVTWRLLRCWGWFLPYPKLITREFEQSSNMNASLPKAPKRNSYVWKPFGI